MLSEFRGRHVLLLQGPNGPFFRRVGRELELAGAKVSKINLNAADAFFYPGPRAFPFRGTREEWPVFLAGFLREQAVDDVFLFGDSRPYHAAAREIALRHGVELYAFEEGYLRPDHVTVERGGVNKNSLMPRDPRAYEVGPLGGEVTRHVEHAFAWSVLFTILNALCVTLFSFRYPHYRHHRDVNAFRQAFYWGRSGVRRVTCALRERHLARWLEGDGSKRYFLVALQVHNDFQVQNSRYRDVEDFIGEVVAAFAASARPEHALLFKHHPADRGYRDYAPLLRRLALEHGLEGRVRYVHDPHLPTVLRHALGTVVINSTVGLSSVHHHTPVFAMEETIYGRMGLVAEGTLEDFFRSPPPVDTPRYGRARAWLIRNNQANGSVWVPLPGLGPAGLVWPPEFGRRVGSSSGEGAVTSEESVSGFR